MAFACFLQAEPSVTMGPCQGAEAHICQLPQAPTAALPLSVLPGKFDADSEPEVRPIIVNSKHRCLASIYLLAQTTLVTHVALGHICNDLQAAHGVTTYTHVVFEM